MLPLVDSFLFTILSWKPDCWGYYDWTTSVAAVVPYQHSLIYKSPGFPSHSHNKPLHTLGNMRTGVEEGKEGTNDSGGWKNELMDKQRGWESGNRKCRRRKWEEGENVVGERQKNVKTEQMLCFCFYPLRSVTQNIPASSEMKRGHSVTVRLLAPFDWT